MLHEIVNYGTFVHLKIIGPELNRKTLEAGYFLLDDYAGRIGNQGIICDFSNIKTVNLNDRDYKEISDGLIVFFLNNDKFRLVDVIPNDEISIAMKRFPDYLKDVGIDRLLTCPDLETAMEIFQSS